MKITKLESLNDELRGTIKIIEKESQVKNILILYESYNSFDKLR